MVILGFVLNQHPKIPESSPNNSHVGSLKKMAPVEVDGVSRAADQAKSVMRLVGGPQIQLGKGWRKWPKKEVIARTYLDKTIEESGLSDR